MKCDKTDCLLWNECELKHDYSCEIIDVNIKDLKGVDC